MNKGNTLDHTTMYRLPYSKNDNPNGWIEITTYCNMKCSGCYKGLDRGDIPVAHEPLHKIKSDILELKRIRNCAIITISGGEALMHPQIEEIVSFVKSQNLKSFIHTNGILINEKIAFRLKNAGLTGFIVRIDVENRPVFVHESQLNKLRDEIAHLIDKIGGLQLGFTTVVTPKNLKEIPDLVKWFQANNKKADYLVLILKREFRFKENEVLNIDAEVSVEQLATVLKNDLPELIFSSYLGNQNQNIGFKWLQIAWIACNGKVLGYADARTIEFATIMGHFKHRNYNYVSNNGRNYLSLAQMIMGSLFLKSMQKVFWQYLVCVLSNPINLFRKANHQVINIVNPPGNTPETMGYCDGCPDAVLYEGVLQPSCVLESLKQMKKN